MKPLFLFSSSDVITLGSSDDERPKSVSPPPKRARLENVQGLISSNGSTHVSTNGNGITTTNGYGLTHTNVNGLATTSGNCLASSYENGLYPPNRIEIEEVGILGVLML